MNVLITGVAGFIGSNLLNSLVESKVNVFGIDNFSTGVKTNLPKEFDNLYYGDIINHSFINEVIRDKKIEIVIHLAAMSGVQPSIQNPVKANLVNITGTSNILDVCVKNNVKKFIFASSGGTILGNQEPPCTEESPIKPISPYGATKAAGEHLVNSFHHSFGLNTTILRFSNIYGPLSMHKKGNLIPEMIMAMDNHENFTVNGDGTQTRDFLFVDDLIDVVKFIIKNNKSNGETYQVATSNETSINDLINIFNKHSKEITGEELKVTYGSPLSGDVKRNYASIDKIKNDLGWIPKTELDSGIKRTLEWYFY